MNFNCKLCNYITERKSDYNKHITTIKHKNKELANIEKNLENQKNFICDKCNKQLSTKHWYNNHILHCRGVSSLLECSKCNKKFNKSITRYIHEKKCTNTKEIIPIDNKSSSITNNINTTNNITNTTNIGEQNNNTINITVNNFGDEKFEYFMEHPDFIKFMNNCIESNIGVFFLYLQPQNCPVV